MEAVVGIFRHEKNQKYFRYYKPLQHRPDIFFYWLLVETLKHKKKLNNTVGKRFDKQLSGDIQVFIPPSPESGIYPPLCFKSRDDELSDMDN